MATLEERLQKIKDDSKASANIIENELPEYYTHKLVVMMALSTLTMIGFELRQMKEIMKEGLKK